MFLVCIVSCFALTCSAAQLAFTKIAVEPIGCPNPPTATVTLFAAGGTPPYSYSMAQSPEHDPAMNAFSGISPAGSYTFTVTDQAQTTISTMITVGPSGPSLVSLEPFYPCNAQANGTLMIIGQSEQLPLQATLTKPTGPPVTMTSQAGRITFTLVGAGTNSVAVSDQTPSCGATTITLSIPDPPVLTLDMVTTTPQTDRSLGSISVTTKGSAGQIYYQLGNQTPVTSSTFTGLTAGTYQIHAGTLRPDGTLDCSIMTHAIVKDERGSAIFVFIQKKYCEE